MPIVLGSSAPDSTWSIAWRNGAAVTTGDTISLSDCSGQVVVLLLTNLYTG
jgi:hypothetical protein